MTTNGSGWRRSDKGAARHISARRSPAGHIAPTRKISSAVLGPNPASIRRAGRGIFGSARVRLGVPGEGERGKESGKLNAFPQISSVTLSDNDFFLENITSATKFGTGGLETAGQLSRYGHDRAGGESPSAVIVRLC